MAAIELDRRSDNLPADVTRFIGRSRDIEQVRDALGRYRLVTLRGVGGVGKTRLALQVGATVRRSFQDGVWLVELSALRNTELLARTAAAALGVPDQGAGDPLDLLADYMTDRHLLLILDTCEHLVAGCALLSEVLLRSAPRLRILATSREPLDVMGEQALLISPLEVPASDASTGAGTGAETDTDAVRLFLDRAESMVPGYALTPANERAVVRLCRRLDGIPLALELAAVRLRTMSIDQVVARIDDRFGFLGTARSSQNRHQTLRAAVDWSYELCTEEEQRLWARLSVFPGDFDLEAAESICDTTVDVLGRLVDKSIALYGRDGHRYRLLDTIREYGAEQLTETDELSRRHAAYYLQLTEQAAGFGPGQSLWLARLQQETHNLRVAMDYFYSTPGQEGNGLRLTVLLRHYWLLRGLFTEGRRWHNLALALDRRTGDGAWARYGAAVLAIQQGDFDVANPLLDQASELAGELNDEHLAAQVLLGRGMALFHAGDLAGGIAWFERAVSALRDTGYAEPFALCVFSRLATACFLNGEIDRAIGLCEEALRLSDELDDAWNRGTALWVRGAARWMSGQTELAIEDVLASLQVKETLGDLHSITQSIDLLAVCLATQGEFVRAAELSGAGDALWDMLGTPAQAGPHYAEARQMGASLCRAGLGEERFAAAHRRGMNLSLAEAIALARGESGPAETGAAEPGEANPLTRRELEIAGLVSQGLGNREVAERLVLSKRTIDAHLEHIFAKLGFSSRVQLAAWFNEISDRN
jgi:predicted ATPase/DNA-binding CsgD family transcriptional regulator